MSQSLRLEEDNGPFLCRHVAEITGVFADEAALEAAIGRLELAGVDRADLSLPHMRGGVAEDAPDGGADAPDTEEDKSQLRTLETGVVASIAAIAAAAAFAASGADLLPVVIAALAAGLIAGAIAEVVLWRLDVARHRRRRQAAAKGELILSVHVGNPARRSLIEAAMLGAGASEVRFVDRLVPQPDPANVDTDENVESAWIWIPGLRLAWQSWNLARPAATKVTRPATMG